MGATCRYARRSAAHHRGRRRCRRSRGPALHRRLEAPGTIPLRMTFTREYVRLRRQTFGVLYSPTRPVPRMSIGLVVMHPNSNYLDHVAGAQMAQRGFRVLRVNGQYFNTRREYLLWEKVPLDVKPAVDYMRQLPALEHVVLVG